MLTKDLPTSKAVPELPSSQPPVHKVSESKPQQRKGSSHPIKSRSECYRCGGKHHHFRCPCKEYECHNCKKKGHLAKMCRQKGREKSEQTHVVLDQQPVEDDKEYTMFHVYSGSYRADVKVNGNSLSMEIDTGASVSIVSKQTLETVHEGTTSLVLKESAVKLQTYTGEVIGVCGSTMVPVEHNGQTVTLPLIVTVGNGPSLLGRDWLSVLRLDWRSIFSVCPARTLQQVLEEHSEVFREELGELHNVKAKIYVDKDTQPVFHKARQVPFAVRKKVEDELDCLQALRVIKPIQFSEWAAPIVPVLKGDGRVRICGDYKVTVNRAAKVDKYSIPRIEELFASLSGGKTFTNLDLSHAYLQVPLDDESRQYVTINTHKGVFEYTRLPFGVASAPAIFQLVMENLLQGIGRVCVYIDDILVTGATEKDHLHNLTQVLQRLHKAGMRLKKDKCAFMLPSVSYLGHVISEEGLHTAESKVQAVVKAAEPRNVTELRSFIGMVNYYGKFIPNLATTLSPLYLLLQKLTPWRWGSKQRGAFRDIKELLRSGRVLTHYDDGLPLILACDATP